MKSGKFLSVMLVLCMVLCCVLTPISVYAEGPSEQKKTTVQMQNNNILIYRGDKQVYSAKTFDKNVWFVTNKSGNLIVRFNDSENKTKGFVIGETDNTIIDGIINTLTIDPTVKAETNFVILNSAKINRFIVGAVSTISIFGSIESLVVGADAKLTAQKGANITEAEISSSNALLKVLSSAVVKIVYRKHPWNLSGINNISEIRNIKTTSSGSSISSGGGSGGGSWNGGNNTGGEDIDEYYDITLSTQTYTLNVGDSGTIVFNAVFDQRVDKIVLTNQSTGQNYDMLDDGNVLNGDDIADDGVYSVQISLDTYTERSFAFVANYIDYRSNQVTIDVFEVLSDAVLAQIESTIETIENRFSEIVSAAGGNTPAAKSVFVSYLKTLESAGEISNVATNSTAPNLVTFEFDGGILGGYMMEEFAPNTFSTQDTPETPQDDSEAFEDDSEEVSQDIQLVSKNITGDTQNGDESQLPILEVNNSDILKTIDNKFQQIINAEGGNNEAAKSQLINFMEELETNEYISGLKISEYDANLFIFEDTNGTVYRYHVINSVGKTGVKDPIPVMPQAASMFLASSNDSMDIVGNNNVLIVSAFDSSDTTYMGSYSAIAATFRNHDYGFNVTERYSATVDDFKSLNDYGIIFINSHGTIYGNDPAICLDERATIAKLKAYNNDLKAKRIAVVGGLFGWGGDFYILPEFIKHYYSGSNKLPNSLVHMCICKGYANSNLVNAFTGRGAGAVLAFTDIVNVSYDGDMMQTAMNELLDGKTADEARLKAISDHGEPDESTTPAYYRLAGKKELKIISSGIINGGFENPVNYYGWSKTGDARIITSLGPLTPPEKSKMSIISTGLGSVNDSNSVNSQNFIVPNNADKISFTYNVVSEEPMEWVGTQYDDTFIAKIMSPSGSDLEILAMETVNTSTWHYIEGIDFYGGDDTTFETGWKTVEIDVSQYRGQSITIYFWVYDRGDSIYDTAALIDDVKIINAA